MSPPAPVSRRSRPGPICISPYCVFYLDDQNDNVTIIHGLYGSTFRLAAALFAKILQGLNETRSAPADPPSAGERAAIRTLAREKILVTQRELNRIRRQQPFRNRLAPVELAFQRAFNEGGGFATPSSPPPPAQKKILRRKALPLETHSLEGAQRGLVDCLFARRSIRRYSDQPLDRAQLEQFLQLTARAYAIVGVPGFGTTSLRNYPSGGARYPLEIYPVLLNVRSLARGFYYYQPFQHALVFLGAKTQYREALRRTVRMAMGRSSHEAGDPAALFIITAVFERTCWKYSGIPHHLILQEVGALYQTMYLGATTLNLAPSAIGAFPERAIGEVLGLDTQDEAQVGLFALGLPHQTESQATGSRAIDSFIVRQGSPFSPHAQSWCLMLTLQDGVTEILDRKDVRLIQSADGSLWCKVQRGRYSARFRGEAESQIRALLRMQDGQLQCLIGTELIPVVTAPPLP